MNIVESAEATDAISNIFETCICDLRTASTEK